MWLLATKTLTTPFCALWKTYIPKRHSTNQDAAFETCMNDALGANTWIRTLQRTTLPFLATALATAYVKAYPDQARAELKSKTTLATQLLIRNELGEILKFLL